MNPVVLQRPDHNVSRKNISSAALKVLRRLNDEGYVAYLAGGGVRDLLLGRRPKDFDIATDARPEEIRKLFRNCRLVGRRFRLAHVLFRGEIVETSTFRAPVPLDDTLHNERTFRTGESGVVLRDNLFGSPEQDALRRDFTINALFYDIANFSVIDYAGGLQDLDDRLIRVIGDPDKRFAEDPVRMVRAARFAGTLGFDIEPEAFESMRRNRDRITLSAPARLYEEVKKLFLCGHAKEVFLWLEKVQLLRPIFPGFSEWLTADPSHRDWVLRAAEQMDRWRDADLEVHPSVLFALVFGAYHESIAQRLIDRGTPPFDAARAAVREHLMDVCNHVRIPKQVVFQIADIMANQSRFAFSESRRAKRFVHNPNFLDAFLYLKFSAKVRGRNEDLLEHWIRLFRLVQEEDSAAGETA